MNKNRLLELLNTYVVLDFDPVELEEVDEEEFIFFLRDNQIDVDELFFVYLAKELGYHFIERDHLKSKGYLASALPYSMIRDHLIFLLEISPDRIKIATANPLNRKIFHHIESIFKTKVELYVASIRAIDEANEAGHREVHKYRALKELYVRHPEESAYKVFYAWQKYLSLGLFLGFLIMLLLTSETPLYFLYLTINILYFATHPVKFYTFFLGLQSNQKAQPVSDNEINNLKERDLPFYTILVPLYRESEVLPQIMENINKIDYPKDKLDVKILLEENDDETINEARKLGLLGNPEKVVGEMSLEEYENFVKLFDLIVVPDDLIKTKPRACNYGLLKAKGDYCVIYDAEDDPDTDQLKKAIVSFSHAEDDYVCFQARLNYYNTWDNFLTKWFTIEYTCWYNYYLQGLEQIGCPIPLGGTSNHFKTRELRKLFGWDPYNVTEDADLGIRIARKQFKTAMLDSYTFEEANSKTCNWIRQRSRWSKGHIQTYLVHMRHPRRTKNELGWKRFLLFNMNFGGNIFIPLVNPFLWALTLLTLLDVKILPHCPYYPLISIAVFNLIIGNLVYISLHMISCLKEKTYNLIPYAMTIPLYWILVSIGAWKGMLQLITRPFYWEKTAHGINKKDID